MVYISKERQAKPPLLFHYFTAADICTDIISAPSSTTDSGAHENWNRISLLQIYTDRWNGFLYFKKKYR